MGFYSDLLDTASELIREFGSDSEEGRKAGPAKLISPGVKSGDSWNPTIGMPTETPCYVIALSFSKKEVDGENVLATDRKFKIDAKGLSADIVGSATKLVFAGVTYQIIGPVEQANPSGAINLIWTAQGRI